MLLKPPRELWVCLGVPGHAVGESPGCACSGARRMHPCWGMMICASHRTPREGSACVPKATLFSPALAAWQGSIAPQKGQVGIMPALLSAWLC